MPVAPGDIYIESHPKDRITTASVGDAEAGRVIVRDQLNNRPPYLYLYGLWVAPDWRREGIGSALMQAAITLYGGERIELIAYSGQHTDSMNADQLMAWYARYGFVPELSASGRAHDSDPYRMARAAG